MWCIFLHGRMIILIGCRAPNPLFGFSTGFCKHKPLLTFGRITNGIDMVSTHGNGLDCHRTWEMLFYGMIPIVKTSSLDVLYRNLSVVVVSEWSRCVKRGVGGQGVSRYTSI